MSRTQLETLAVRPDLRDVAAEAARAAARRAGVDVRPLETLAELEACSELIERIWDDGEPKAPSSLLRALTHAGNFVAGAYSAEHLVGVSLGFFGLTESQVVLHSHITGVAPAAQSRSVGFALKQYQRWWALGRGIGVVQWTVDPLVRGNLHFNLVKLGATVVAYHDDFYGPLRDRLNAGEESDRVVMSWELASDRSVRAASGRPAEHLHGEGAIILRADADGRPVAGGGVDGNVVLAWIPEDVVHMREERPDCAREWRRAVRGTVGGALAKGYRAETITRDGWLVLTR